MDETADLNDPGSVANELARKLEYLKDSGVDYVYMPPCVGCAAIKEGRAPEKPGKALGGPVAFLSTAQNEAERELLSKMIAAMGLKEEEVLIIIKSACSAGGTFTSPTECVKGIIEEIRASGASVIVTLGPLPTALVLGVQGTKRPFKLQRGSIKDAPGLRKVKVMATHSLSGLLEEKALKKEAWEDLKKVMAELRQDAT